MGDFDLYEMNEIGLVQVKSKQKNINYLLMKIKCLLRLWEDEDKYQGVECGVGAIEDFMKFFLCLKMTKQNTCLKQQCKYLMV